LSPIIDAILPAGFSTDDAIRPFVAGAKHVSRLAASGAGGTERRRAGHYFGALQRHASALDGRRF
jgi:hypothetical protein